MAIRERKTVMTIIEKIGDATLYLGDCLDILPTIGGVDGVVTSPPYGTIRDYGGHAPVDCLAVISACADLLGQGGVIMWNVNDQVIDGSESGESFRHALHAMAIGLRLHDTMIYCKSGVTFPDSNRYLPSFEYMFVFSRGAPKHFNALKDRRNHRAGKVTDNTERQKDGSLERKKKSVVLPFGLRQNWWLMSGAPSADYVDGHPAQMPMEMARGHVYTWTDANETVLDPFMGSGTTGVACANLGRKFIGIEIEPKYFDIACERITYAQNQLRLFA